MLKPIYRASVLLLDNKLTGLALMIGLFQATVVYWLVGVALGQPGGPSWAALPLGLVLANVAVLPSLRAGRYRHDRWGRTIRSYLGVCIATAMIGSAVFAAWGGFAAVLLANGWLDAPPPGAFETFRWTSAGFVGVVALIALWGFTLGARLVDHSALEVAIPGLAPQLDGLRIAHISDLHIGNALEAPRLARLVDLTNARGADLIVVTGDLFDGNPAVLESGARELGRLHAPRGVFAILGNHDHHHVGAERVAEALRRHAPGVRLLRDEIVAVPGPAPLYLAGADDPGDDWYARDVEIAGVEAMAAERPGDGPTLLLAHRPEVLRQAARLGYPLVLSGHTHGGQITLPPPVHHVGAATLYYQYVRGVYRLEDTTLYVNRGLGVGGPALRLNCRREIAVLSLRAEPSPA